MYTERDGIEALPTSPPRRKNSRINRFLDGAFPQRALSEVPITGGLAERVHVRSSLDVNATEIKARKIHLAAVVRCPAPTARSANSARFFGFPVSEEAAPSGTSSLSPRRRICKVRSRLPADSSPTPPELQKMNV